MLKFQSVPQGQLFAKYDNFALFIKKTLLSVLDMAFEL